MPQYHTSQHAEVKIKELEEKLFAMGPDKDTDGPVEFLCRQVLRVEIKQVVQDDLLSWLYKQTQTGA